MRNNFFSYLHFTCPQDFLLLILLVFILDGAFIPTDISPALLLCSWNNWAFKIFPAIHLTSTPVFAEYSPELQGITQISQTYYE